MCHKYFLVIIHASAFLLSCSQSVTYSYLMEHPKELRQRQAHCQTATLSVSEISQCQVVAKAYQDHTQLIAEMLKNPQDFGMKILKAQIRLVEVSEENKRIKQALEQQSKETTSTVDLQKKARETQNTMNALSADIRYRLAVLQEFFQR